MTSRRVPHSLRLAWRDKWLLAAAFGLLWRARIRLSAKGFGDPLQECAKTARLPLPPAALSARVAWSVNHAARFVAGPTCLVRAMAGQQLLAMKGYGSEIRVGVRSSGDAGFEAHAWLATGDTVILGGTPSELARFSALIGVS